MIPLAEVASRATEVEALLRTTGRCWPHSDDLDDREAAARTERSSSAWNSSGHRAFCSSSRRSRPSRTQQEVWARRQLLTSTWLTEFTQRVRQLQGALTRLADQHRTWTQTRDAARAAKAPEPILAQIAEVLAAIEAAQIPLQTGRAAALDLQGRVAREVARCETALAQIGEAQTQVMGGLLERDRPPIWSGELWARVSTAGFRNVRDTAIELVAGDAQGVPRIPPRACRSTAVLFVVLAVLLWAARRWTSAFRRRGGLLVRDRGVRSSLFRRAAHRPDEPSSHLWHRAPGARELLQVILLVPVIRLTRPVVDPRVVPTSSCWRPCSFDTVRRVRRHAGLEPAILALEMVAGSWRWGTPCPSGVCGALWGRSSRSG